MTRVLRRDEDSLAAGREVGYPLVVTGLAQLMFPKQANGELISGPGGKLVNQFWPSGEAEYVEAGVAVSPAGTYF